MQKIYHNPVAKHESLLVAACPHMWKKSLYFLIFSYTCKNPFIFYRHIANMFSEYNKHDSNNNFECAHTPTGALEIHDCLIVARRDADAFGVVHLYVSACLRNYWHGRNRLRDLFGTLHIGELDYLRWVFVLSIFCCCCCLGYV